MTEQPSAELLRRLYGEPSHVLDATLRALEARREHINTLIVMLEAERAMREPPQRSKM